MKFISYVIAFFAIIAAALALERQKPKGKKLEKKNAKKSLPKKTTQAKSDMTYQPKSLKKSPQKPRKPRKPTKLTKQSKNKNFF